MFLNSPNKQFSRTKIAVIKVLGLVLSNIELTIQQVCCFVYGVVQKSSLAVEDTSIIEVFDHAARAMWEVG